MIEGNNQLIGSAASGAHWRLSPVNTELEVESPPFRVNICCAPAHFLSSLKPPLQQYSARFSSSLTPTPTPEYKPRPGT